MMQAYRQLRPAVLQRRPPTPSEALFRENTLRLRSIDKMRAAQIMEQVAGPSRLRAAPQMLRRLLNRCIHISLSAQSGHNRWSKIRHRKGAADAQKSVLFSRMTNEIHAALRPPASPDPISNSRLATALAKAREGGVPKQVIEHCFVRARATAEGTGQSVVYEAVGPSGREAMVIECLTENPARTVQRLKELLHKRDCRIASVSFLFEKKRVIVVSATPEGGFDELFEIAVEGGAEDVRETKGDDGLMYEIITPPTELLTLTTTLSSPTYSARYPIQSSKISYIPSNPLAVLEQDEVGEGISEDKAEAVQRAAGLLELEGDVVKVWTNLG